METSDKNPDGETLTPEEAAQMVEIMYDRGEDCFILYDVKSITVATAKELAKFKRDYLNLCNLETLNPPTAEALAKFEGTALYLGSLKTIDQSTAEALVRFGGVIELYGLKTADQATVTVLAGHGKCYIDSYELQIEQPEVHAESAPAEQTRRLRKAILNTRTLIVLATGIVAGGLAGLSVTSDKRDLKPTEDKPPAALITGAPETPAKPAGFDKFPPNITIEPVWGREGEKEEIYLALKPTDRENAALERLKKEFDLSERKKPKSELKFIKYSCKETGVIVYVDDEGYIQACSVNDGKTIEAGDEYGTYQFFMDVQGTLDEKLGAPSVKKTPSEEPSVETRETAKPDIQAPTPAPADITQEISAKTADTADTTAVPAPDTQQPTDSTRVEIMPQPPDTPQPDITPEAAPEEPPPPLPVVIYQSALTGKVKVHIPKTKKALKEQEADWEFIGSEQGFIIFQRKDGKRAKTDTTNLKERFNRRLGEFPMQTEWLE